MFAEAGCDDQHLSEQPVKGSKLPNIVCLLPGSSDRMIIVGAHFDHVSDAVAVAQQTGARVFGGPPTYDFVRANG